MPNAKHIGQTRLTTSSYFLEKPKWRDFFAAIWRESLILIGRG
jgi:hypothetical protein